MDWLIDFMRPFSFRGKARLLAPVTPRSGTKLASVFGYQLPLDLANYVDRTIYLGCYEPLNTWRFREILSPGMTVVDVGANIGYFSLLAAKLVGPSGKVMAIEPHPTNAKILSEALRVNGLAQVELFRFGLGDESARGEISMVDQVAFPNRTASMVPAKSDTSVSVEVKKLDDCVAEWGLTRIDLLKIDVDGLETKIIAGASRSLKAGLIKNIIVEFNDYWLGVAGSSAEKLRGSIEGAGLIEVTGKSGAAGFFLGKSEDRHFTLP